MRNPKFSDLIQQARDLIKSITYRAESHHGRELCKLKQIIDDLEKINSKDPPIDWNNFAQVVLIIIDLIREIIQNLKT